MKAFGIPMNPQRGACDGRRGEEQGGSLVADHDAQGTLITHAHPVDQSLEATRFERWPFCAQKATAKHWSECQRDKTGNQDCHPDGHREFIEQTPQDSAHEKHRQKNGGQRDCH
jgi:hypothetical protein